MRIEFDEQNAKVARALGRALLEIAGGDRNLTFEQHLRTLPDEDLVATLGAERAALFKSGGLDLSGRGADKSLQDIRDGEKPLGINFAPANPVPEITGRRSCPELGAGYDSGTTVEMPAGYGIVATDCCPTHDEPTAAVELDDVTTTTPFTAAPAFAKALHQAADSLRVDMHGVRFDDRYCAEAEEPFYTTGKQKGQWKKRRGVEENEYSNWYESQRPAAPVATPMEPAPLPVTNVAAAFGAHVAPVARPLPANAGELMTWCAELQAAGRLTQPDITAAYADLGLALFDIFEPVAADLISERIGKLYAILSAKAGV